MTALPRTATADERLAVCLRCPQLSPMGICRRQRTDDQGAENAGCGCIVRAKVLLPRQRCPQGKW